MKSLDKLDHWLNTFIDLILMYLPFKLMQLFKRGIVTKFALLPNWFSGHSPIHNSTNNIFYDFRWVYNNLLTFSQQVDRKLITLRRNTKLFLNHKNLRTHRKCICRPIFQGTILNTVKELTQNIS